MQPQADNGAARPFVSIAMPALNEERYIADAIASIVPSTDAFDWELMVVDGGSTDGTRAIVESIAANDRRIQLLTNDRRIQAAAVNLAARQADPRAVVLVRADCHASYPDQFVERCVAKLLERKVASVVVPMSAKGFDCVQSGIAAAQNRRFGNGGAAHRTGHRSGFVDHGHHAAFDKNAFLAVGGYDERFVCNEDAELDIRFARAGHRIYLDAANSIDYYPRTTFRSLARQYFAYGRGRARTIIKHPSRPKLRQLAPVALVLGCSLSLILAPLDARWLSLPLSYALVCIGWGCGVGVKEKRVCAALAAPAAILMHSSWGAGFIFEMTRAARELLAGPSTMSTQGSMS